MSQHNSADEAGRDGDAFDSVSCRSGSLKPQAISTTQADRSEISGKNARIEAAGPNRDSGELGSSVAYSNVVAVALVAGDKPLAGAQTPGRATPGHNTPSNQFASEACSRENVASYRDNSDNNQEAVCVPFRTPATYAADIDLNSPVDQHSDLAVSSGSKSSLDSHATTSGVDCGGSTSDFTSDVLPSIPRSEQQNVSETRLGSSDRHHAVGELTAGGNPNRNTVDSSENITERVRELNLDSSIDTGIDCSDAELCRGTGHGRLASEDSTRLYKDDPRYYKESTDTDFRESSCDDTSTHSGSIESSPATTPVASTFNVAQEYFSASAKSDSDTLSGSGSDVFLSDSRACTDGHLADSDDSTNSLPGKDNLVDVSKGSDISADDQEPPSEGHGDRFTVAANDEFVKVRTLPNENNSIVASDVDIKRTEPCLPSSNISADSCSELKARYSRRSSKDTDNLVTNIPTENESVGLIRIRRATVVPTDSDYDEEDGEDDEDDNDRTHVGQLDIDTYRPRTTTHHRDKHVSHTVSVIETGDDEDSALIENIDVPNALFRSYSDSAIAIFSRANPMESTPDTASYDNDDDPSLVTDDDRTLWERKAHVWERRISQRELATVMTKYPVIVRTDSKTTNCTDFSLHATPGTSGAAIDMPDSGLEKNSGSIDNLTRSTDDLDRTSQQPTTTTSQTTGLYSSAFKTQQTASDDTAGKSLNEQQTPIAVAMETREADRVSRHDRQQRFMAINARTRSTPVLVKSLALLGSANGASKGNSAVVSTSTVAGVQGPHVAMSAASTPASRIGRRAQIGGVQSPRSSTVVPASNTGTIGRTRPRLPTGLLRVRSAEKQEPQTDNDVGGILNSLSSTNFVRKYARRPSAAIMSPEIKSPPPDTSGLDNERAMTLTRMRNLKIKLEKVREAQDANDIPRLCNAKNLEAPAIGSPSKAEDPQVTSPPRCLSPYEDTGGTKQTSPSGDTLRQPALGRRTGAFMPLPGAVPDTCGRTNTIFNTDKFRLRRAVGSVSPSVKLAKFSLSLGDVKRTKDEEETKDTFDTDDEGVCSTDMDVQYYKDAYTALDEKTTSETISHNEGGTTSKSANGRFLTHPPVRDRVIITREGGSLDSNGLGSLRDTSAPLRSEELTSPVSEASLDSHIGEATDTTASECYRDVILDVTAAGTDISRMERKNSKTLKQKSKSDPTGQKQKESLVESVLAETQSSPLLGDDELVLPEMTPDTNKSKAKSDNFLLSTAKHKSSKHAVLTKTLSTTDDESSGHELQTNTVKRRPSKKRHRSGLVGVATEMWEAKERKGKKEESRKTRSKSRVESPRSATAPDLAGGGETIEAKSSLSLPASAAKGGTALMRSHSSASVYGHKGAPGSGARPKEFTYQHADAAQTKSQQQTFDGCGSVPDLSHVRAERVWSTTFSPSLEPIFSQSALSLFEGSAEEKDKRDLIVQELFSSEQQYVEALKMLVEKYMIPLKTQGILDSHLVDDMFYKINEIYMHHATLLAFMERSLKNWHNLTTVGDILCKNFSKQTVIESYISFIENFPRAEKVLDDLSTKSSFSKFLEQCERDNKTKLPLKAQIVKPAQRIPRYELLLRRLLNNTPEDHPDHSLLLKAQKCIHDLAMRINSVKESKHDEDLQMTLKKLELLLMIDLISPERLYVRHDMVQILGRKDQCCIWLFSDLAVFSSVKRKSGPINKRSSLMLQSPAGNDFVENVKHKMWLRIPLNELEVRKPTSTMSKRDLVDRGLLEEDFSILSLISVQANKLSCPHQDLDDTVREMMNRVNRQLSEHQLKSPPPEANRVELLATSVEGVSEYTVVFSTQEKRALWETAILEAKQKLELSVDGKDPEFLQPLTITKTRAGMQFSCAAATEGTTSRQPRDVWVCNSDGYVGHMCLLSLQPEPIVTLNTPVPGCNSRILCICAVPVFQCRRRRNGLITSATVPLPEHSEKTDKDSELENGYLSDSSSSASEDYLNVDEEDGGISLQFQSERAESRSASPATTLEDTNESVMQDPSKSSMWLGTEDGCIHIFPATENLKTTKNRIKVQQSAGVLCLVHLDQKVFVSLANGDLVVYQRDSTGVWAIENPQVVSLGNATSPINRMLAVAGKLWCACQNEILVINPTTLIFELTFRGHPDTKRSIYSMACSGLGVWLAPHASAKLFLIHATTYDFLMELNVAPAVAQKLQTADDIIRQHKTACLRITTLLACKDLLWVGTSAGVILTLPIPKVTSTTARTSITAPTITGLIHGHTGHVRFLTCVEMPQPKPATLTTDDDHQTASLTRRRPSMSTHTLTIATKMLVISGGDGYEDFSNNVLNESAGRDDSTNHLLLWHV